MRLSSLSSTSRTVFPFPFMRALTADAGDPGALSVNIFRKAKFRRDKRRIARKSRHEPGVTGYLTKRPTTIANAAVRDLRHQMARVGAERSQDSYQPQTRASRMSFADPRAPGKPAGRPEAPPSTASGRA